MSHALTLSAIDLEKMGVPVVRNLEALRRTCVKLKIKDPKYVENYNLEGKTVTGWQIELSGWYKPVTFDLEKGECHFDNYPTYNNFHPDVVAGRRRMGEGGRWGDFQKMLDLEGAYETAATRVMYEEFMSEANMSGEMVQTLSETDDRIEVMLSN